MNSHLSMDRYPEVRSFHSSDEEASFKALVNEAFLVPHFLDFFDDFPVWDPKLRVPGVERWGAFIQGKLIGCVSVRTAQLTLQPQIWTPVGILGSVAVHPQWRQRGLASLLVQKAVQWLREQRVSVVLLWSSRHSLYERLGFQLAGEQLRAALSQTNFLEEQGQVDTSGQVQTGWSPILFSHLMSRGSGLLIQSSDRIWLQAHRNVQWYWIEDSISQEFAYAGVGRGIDLPGMVHEWGGCPRLLKRVLKKIMQEHPSAELLGNRELFQKFNLRFQTVVSEYLCMAQVIHPFSGFSETQSEEENQTQESGLGYAFKGNSTEDRDQLLRRWIRGLFQAPRAAEEVIVEQQVPLWIWGLDAA
ncbi:MAG: GNAT family N-acetyltransferase [Bdellovibrionia bacterium]